MFVLVSVFVFAFVFEFAFTFGFAFAFLRVCVNACSRVVLFVCFCVRVRGRV